MPDFAQQDVPSTLSDLERKLVDLERELTSVAGGPPTTADVLAAVEPAAAPAPLDASIRIDDLRAQITELVALRDQLQSAARELVDEYGRLVDRLQDTQDDASAALAAGTPFGPGGAGPIAPGLAGPPAGVVTSAAGVTITSPAAPTPGFSQPPPAFSPPPTAHPGPAPAFSPPPSGSPPGPPPAFSPPPPAFSPPPPPAAPAQPAAAAAHPYEPAVPGPPPGWGPPAPQPPQPWVPPPGGYEASGAPAWGPPQPQQWGPPSPQQPAGWGPPAAYQQPPAAAAPPAEDPGPSFEGPVVVDAGPFNDITTLSAFEQALARVPGAEDVYVRSFEGNRAVIDLRLQGPVLLVGELKNQLGLPMTVREAHEGRLSVDVVAGSHGP